jgi:hypothetical protein
MFARFQHYESVQSRKELLSASAEEGIYCVGSSNPAGWMPVSSKK